MQDVSNGNLFCKVKEVLDTNVNIPPTPPDDHTTTNATCASSVPWGKRSTRTLTSPPPPPWRSYDNICNLCLFHVQHVKKSKISNPIPPFRKTSFLKFATLPRDRKWHISKSTTLPRAPYQPHADNNGLFLNNRCRILLIYQYSPYGPWRKPNCWLNKKWVVNPPGFCSGWWPIATKPTL